MLITTRDKIVRFSMKSHRMAVMDVDSRVHKEIISCTVFLFSSVSSQNIRCFIFTNYGSTLCPTFDSSPFFSFFGWLLNGTSEFLFYREFEFLVLGQRDRQIIVIFVL